MDQSLKCETIKIFDKNIGENLGDLRIGEEFLDITPKNISFLDLV